MGQSRFSRFPPQKVFFIVGLISIFELQVCHAAENRAVQPTEGRAQPGQPGHVEQRDPASVGLDDVQRENRSGNSLPA